MNFKTKQLTQGAMIVAMFGVLSLINTYTASAFDIFILYGMVIPVVYYGYHYSLKETLVVSFASIIVIFITGVPYFSISAIFSCVEGIYIAECLKHKASKSTILIGVITLAVINNILLYQVFSGFLGINISQEMEETYTLLKPYIGSQISLSQMQSLIPMVILLMGALEGYVIVMICNLVLNRFHIAFPHNYHLSYMHYSKTTGSLLILMVIVGMMGYQIASLAYYEYLYLIGIVLLSLQGLSYILYICICRNYSKYIQILVVMLIFVPIVIYVYGILGIADIFMDLRGNYGK